MQLAACLGDVGGDGVGAHIERDAVLAGPERAQRRERGRIGRSGKRVGHAVERTGRGDLVGLEQESGGDNDAEQRGEQGCARAVRQTHARPRAPARRNEHDQPAQHHGAEEVAHEQPRLDGRLVPREETGGNKRSERVQQHQQREARHDEQMRECTPRRSCEQPSQQQRVEAEGAEDTKAARSEERRDDGRQHSAYAWPGRHASRVRPHLHPEPRGDAPRHAQRADDQ